MSALLLALLLQGGPAPVATASPAPSPAPFEAPAEHHSAQATASEGHGAAEGHASGATEGSADPAALILHHVGDQPLFGLPSKHLLYFFLAALLVVLGARAAVRSYRGGHVPHGIGAAVEALVLFIRDEVAEPNIGHEDARRFTPLLCSFFFFILVAALLGLVPLPGYQGGHWSFAGTTSTGNLAVTAALALVSFAAQQWAGISKYGLLGHFRNLVPPGLPLPLLPMMILVEILGMFTKPFALMIRLFANMLAGHMVIVTLLLLIPLMGQASWVGGALMTPVSIGLSLFIMFLEILVAFIQAYIFTLLTAVFIGMYAHPAH
jgi:F-type H+-transporting ATPase subunit a